jgi:prepilin-type N-terminal cleavage/methylation domain-containing protein
MKFIKKRAFTLIEIAVVIIVIGVLIAGISQAMEMFAEASLKSARNLSKSSRLGRIDDLTLWFDATSEKAFDKEKDDNSAVSIWKDTNPKSTTSISSSSSIASLYPSYTLSAINSLPAVSFKKTSSLVGNCVTVPNESFINNSEDFTLYLIYSPKTLDDGIILEKNNASVTTFPFSLELLSGSYKFSVKNSTSTISVTSPKQAIIKTPNLIRLSRIKGSQIEIVIDGVSTTETDTLTSSTFNNAELSIGCRNGSTPANFISGDFGETAFFNRNINVKEKAEIEEYLYKKWKMKKFEGTLPAITTPTPAITCTVPNANTNSDGNSVGLTTTATSLTCKTGFTGSPTYTCTGANNPGNYLAGGTPCTAIVNTCSLAGGAGYSAKTLLPVGSASFPCDEGYTGTINYDCPSSGGTATKTGGSCTASPIKCYAIDRVGLRGTNYFLNASDGDGQYQNIEVWSDVFRIYSDVTNTPLVNRIKLLDVYHGPLIYQSTQNSYIFDFNPIDTSKFSTTSYPSLITYETLFFPYEFWYVSSTNTFTKYARILDYGTNTFTCDSGFTGTLTYNCTVDGSTLNPTSGSCTAN